MRLADIIGGVLGIAVALVIAPSCKDPNTARNVVTGLLDIEQTACVILQSELGATEPAAIADICSIPPGLIQQVTNLFTAHRKAKAKLAMGLKK